ncbi:hypothetical protein Tco_0527760 [Tanacetum coccineum]
MFKVVKRLKLLKKPLRKLLYDQRNVHENVKKLRHELDEAQKAKIEWLKLGDANITYFHKVVKSQVSRNRIDCVTTSEGIYVDGYQEIHDAMFSMRDNKAPGPDGYSGAFFKEAWDIIEVDVTNAIKEFFTNGVLLKELNHTFIALIPKVTSPMKINDYRPISCCNELMHNYHLDRGVPRCTFKVDIQKAYDTVDWNFLNEVLHGFGFHPRMIGWIMECVTSTSFSISINGSLHGYFKGKRGLRQGDPMSPYLFTLVMEVLTLMLHRRARVSNCFTYHQYCSDLNIINLRFADDLFLFAHDDVDSARVIMDSLEEFKYASGLTQSLPKSTAYFCNVLNYVKLDILNILPFEEGKLLVKYLGVPLVPSRLVYRDCAELMERIKKRVSDWKNKFLSFAGGTQLISYERFPLVSMRDEKGILSGKESLWVKWIHSYKLNGCSFWDIPLRGNGKLTFAWYDNWCSLGHLSNVILNCDIYSAGFRLDAKVSNIINDRNWSWPIEWYNKHPSLVNVVAPTLSEAADCISLRNLYNMDMGFSIAAVWECIRPKTVEVNWFHVVWFSHQILRHAIHLWLVIKRKLKTQDLLRQWDVSNSRVNVFVCPLCEAKPDSHNHLFFGCQFSSQVWEHMKYFMCIPNIPSDLDAIVDFLILLAKSRSIRSVICKLVFAAFCYFIWQERNRRFFSKTKRSHDHIIKMIKSNVRLKLLTCSF